MAKKEYFLTDLRDDIAEESGYDKNDIENILRMAFNKLGDKVAKGFKLYIINFFNFFPKDYKEKNVKHPQTNEPMVIEPYRTVTTKPTKAMKRKLKEGLEDDLGSL